LDTPIKQDGRRIFFDCLLWDIKNQRAWLLADPIHQRLNLLSLSEDREIHINPTKSPLLQPKEAFFAASGSSMIQLGNKLYLIGGGADTVKTYQYNIATETWTSIPLQISAGDAKGYFSIGAKTRKPCGL